MIIGTLRNKMGKVLVVLLVLVMIAFVGGEFFNSLGFSNRQELDIAEIAGTTISNTKFQSKVDELSYNFAINAGRNPLQQELEQIRNQAWNALILEEAYQKQFDELGISVTNDELIDMVQGVNISPQIIRFFSDPNTGKFSKENITNFLASLQQAPENQRNSWISFERSLVPDRLIQKYNNLMEKTNYVTSYEAKDWYTSQNASMTIDYLFVPFLSIPDSAIQVKDTELEDYLEENATAFKREETRSLEYVIFDIKPSSADTAIVQEEINQLRTALGTMSNDSTFVSMNSDDPYPFITYNESNLPDSLKGKEVGFITEPVIINGSYEFYKLSRKDEITPDSILYRVAKVRKDISQYISDETTNEAYRKADLFAASASDIEEFRKLAEEEGLRILKGNRIGKNANQVGGLVEARSLVLWLYNEGETGRVSEVKEVDGKYIVAAMTSEQKEGLANLEDVRNQVERKVKNDKKAKMVIEKLNALNASDIESLASGYGKEAKTGSADFQLYSNTIPGIGYAPEAVGLAVALDEEEMTRAFAVQDGVVILKLSAKDLPAEIDDYSAFALEVSDNRSGQKSLIADFPLSFFRVIVSKKIDDTVKEFADIEDKRYKFY